MKSIATVEILGNKVLNQIEALHLNGNISKEVSDSMRDDIISVHHYYLEVKKWRDEYKLQVEMYEDDIEHCKQAYNYDTEQNSKKG